jgi:putative FmdB family regulatory protein
MPTYVYRREDGSTFEVVQRISEDPLTVDPETGQKVQRVISGAGLVFKGSGFYLTDYVHKGGKKEDKAETKAEKPEAKAEPKAEKKAEPAKAAPSKD